MWKGVTGLLPSKGKVLEQTSNKHLTEYLQAVQSTVRENRELIKNEESEGRSKVT